MKCPRTIPFLRPGLAIGAKRHEGFAEAWNWLIHSFWHMKLGDGLKWVSKWQGYPEIHLKIEGGEGIKVDYKSGKVKISLANEEDDEEDTYTSGGGGGTTPGDDSDPYHTGGGGHRDGELAGGGGNGAESGDVADESDDKDDDEDGGNEDSCNEFSKSPDNEDQDPGMDNPGDNCAVENGW
jgi:hypothetical protein